MKDYDENLHQFREHPKPKMNTLEFNRFRADRGDFGHLPFSLPRGDFALAIVMRTGKPIEKYWNEHILDRLVDHIARTGDY